jgi:iron complex transport system substrate-binding protein
MRIVSLLPSATEIVCALGLHEQLVGVSHRCDFPPEIEGVAVVTRPAAGPGANDTADAGATSAAGASSAAAMSLDDELGQCELDRVALLAARPDLILVRDTGFGPTSRQLEAVLVGADFTPAIVVLDPITLEGIFNTISTLGAMTETEDDAIELLGDLREDIGEIEQQVVARQDLGTRPMRVVVLEGFSPLVASGRWIPEQVRRSGGWELLGREGEPASPTTWEAIREVDPEMLMFAPAGLTLRQTKAAWREIERPDFWEDLEAVRRGQVFFLESVYFCRPGPRVVDGVAMLAEIFDPDGFIETSPPNSWTPFFE